MYNSKEIHLQELTYYCIILKGTLGKGLLFKWSTGLRLEAYADADYAGSLVNRRSTQVIALSQE